MKRVQHWLHLIAAAHVANAEIWTADDVVIRRVPGGYNNALYRIEEDEARYACKLCVADGRQRAAHEYETLRLLHAADLDMAPEPLWLDESCTVVLFPVVIYRWLPGSPLQPPLTTDEVAALLSSFQRAHAIRPGNFDSDLQDSWFHKFNFAWYLTELEDFLQEYGPWLATTDPDGKDLRDRLARLVDGCMEVATTNDADPSREHIAVGLCRVDANLANTVWGPDGRLRWVDWEYSGWGDPALDLADMRWHAALDRLSERQRHWLRDNYHRPDDDEGFDKRLTVWDHIIATRWCFLSLRWLSSLRRGPDRVRLTQLTTSPAQVRAQLVHHIKRAERFASKAARCVTHHPPTSNPPHSAPVGSWHLRATDRGENQ